MSTERKPGSRGVRDPFAGGRANPDQRIGNEPAPRDKENAKGSTKTVSPRKSFKRKPRK
ncbi:MAG: hypothetical protein GY715_18765 [Planctomycetes bacterium]|nr:hypothetical protein [Planctomycetota bacterium]